MKPLEKVVTAPDVESCLYYVHLDTEDDKKLLVDPAPSVEHHSPVKANAQPAQSHQAEAIKRKPLSANPETIHGDLLGQPVIPRHHTQGPIRNLGAPYQTSPQRPDLRGPRPMQPRFHSTGDHAVRPTLGKTYIVQDTSPERWSEQPALRAPESPPRPNALNQSADSGSHEGTQATGFYYPHVKPYKLQPYRDQAPGTRTNSDFSLTLIRRYDGMQADVGKITHQIERHGNIYGQEGLKGRSPLRSPNITIVLDILTPGYSKFDHAVSKQDGSQSRRPVSQRHPTSTSDVDQDESTYMPTRTFRRQLQTFQKRPPPQCRLESNDSYLSSAKLRSNFDMNPYIQQSLEGFDMDKPSPNIPPGSTNSDARGSVFESPWHGSCEFSTGIAGRSLKCKHTIGSRSEMISELRFNLPSSRAFASTSRPPSSPTSMRESKRSSIFSHHGKTQSASEYPAYQKNEGKVDLEDRMDLSLGQERAGGGFGGKQAKLGKLIIENEGLKMLDLIVAANLALWWKVYEQAA